MAVLLALGSVTENLLDRSTEFVLAGVIPGLASELWLAALKEVCCHQDGAQPQFYSPARKFINASFPNQ